MALQLSRKHILEIDFHSPYSIASADLEAKEGMPQALLTPIPATWSVVLRTKGARAIYRDPIQGMRD